MQKNQKYNIIEQKELVIDSILDIKGENIIELDLSSLKEAPAKKFIICEGTSFVHVRSIASNIFGRVQKEMKMKPDHYEGTDTGTWVLLDYFDLVVHVFLKETRAFYNLEDLWSDAQKTVHE